MEATESTLESELDNTDIFATFMAYVVILRDIKSKNINIGELHKHDKRIVVVLPIYDGIVSNLESIRILIENQKCNEAYVIARSLIERVITFLYLQCCTDEEFDRYIMYTSQKAYRKLNEKLVINGKSVSIETTNEINLNEFPVLKKAVDTFTSKKSKREITRWSNTSLLKKLELIDSSSIISEAQINIIILFLNSFYDDASEATHSTMYGCDFHFGGYNDNRKNVTDKEILKDYNDLMRLLLCITAVTASVIISYTGKTYNIKGLDKVIRNLNERVFSELDPTKSSS